MKNLYVKVLSGLIYFLLIFGTFAVNGQTVLINPAGDGGFENGSTFADNGWTVANTPNSPYNAWWVGTAPSQFATNAAYVSDDMAGGTHSYNITQGNQIHFYRDVTFPAGEPIIELEFDVVVQGENNWDLLQVSLVPTSVTPTGEDTYPGSGVGAIIPGAIVLGNFVLLGTDVNNISITLPASVIGNCDEAVTWRLVFSWKSDTSVGTQPPAAIDNISLTSDEAPVSTPDPSLSPFTINNTLATGGTNFNNFTDAINWLNDAVYCPSPIVFNVSANQVFTEDPPEILASGSEMNEIIFQRSGAGPNPVIQKLSPGVISSSTSIGSHGDAIITIVGGDYITFDGIDLETDPTFTGDGMIEYGYYLQKASGFDACKNVTIRNSTITLDKSAVYSYGIFVSNNSGADAVTVTSIGGRHENIKIYNNTISNAYGGIKVRGFNDSAPYDFFDQNIEIGVDGGNTISDFGGAGTAVHVINAIYQNNCKINNNDIEGGAGSTGILYGIILDNSPNGSYDVDNNTISLTSNSTTSILAGIYSNMGTVGHTTNTVNITNNTLTNFSRPSATSGATYFIYSSANSPSSLNIMNNTIGNSTFTGTGLLIGINNLSTPTDMVIDGNTISNLTREATTSSSFFYGIRTTGSSTTHNAVISNNTIHSLMGHGSTGQVGGINLGTVNNATIEKNKIYGITSDHASANVYGIIFTSVSDAKIYNNLIGDLNAPSVGNSTATNPSIRGINMSSAFANSTRDIAYNTILLDGGSSGTNFGTAGIFHAFSATETSSNLTLRNNIVVNNTTPNGSGRAVAFHRSGVSTNNYNTASNNNLFYAGTPGPDNLIYSDNTNLMENLVDFQCLVAPRESQSVTENPPFLSLDGSSPDFLHINPATPTRVESGGISIPGIDEDYSGNIRQGSPGYTGTGSAPDIGANEGEFMLIDVVGPLIFFEPISNTICLDPATISAEITDASGVNTNPGTAPRLWFKKATEDNVLPSANNSTENGWKWVEADNTSSPFTFTFDYTLLTSAPSGGDEIEYFIVAQDLETIPNVGFFEVVFDDCGIPEDVSLDGSLFPVSGTNSFLFIDEPVSVEAIASPGEICIVGDVLLSINPGEIGADYQWESSPAGANMWTPIPGADTETHEVFGLTESTDFRLVISCGGVEISASPSSVVSVEVFNQEVLSTTPAEACGPGPVSMELSATASVGAELNWYDVEVGGEPIGMGGTFNTPPITETTTFYVAANEGVTGEEAAKPTYISTANTSGNQWGLVFDVINSAITIETVDVFSTAAAGGSITVELQNSDGDVLETAGPFPFPAGSVANPTQFTLPVNLTVPIGSGYRIVSADMSGNLIRETTGNTYPYVSPSGNVVVTSGFITNPGSNTYYWFYNWWVTSECETDRVPVTATVINDEVECPQNFSVCGSASPFALTGGSPEGGNYSGNGVVNDVFDPAAAGPGSHQITYTLCISSCEFTITVEDAVTSITVEENSGLAPDDGIICSGDSATLTAAAAETYSWSTGETTQSITVSPVENTVYSVTTTDSFGCPASESVEIIVDPLPVINIEPSNPVICEGESVMLAASGGNSYVWSTGETTQSITVEPQSTTTYSVIGTDSNNCSGEGFVTVTVNELPEIEIDSLIQPTTCLSNDGGVILTITGASPYEFNWSTSNGSGIVQGQQNQSTLSVGTYTVEVTDSNDCMNSLTFTLIGPGDCGGCPVFGDLTANPDVHCAGDSSILTASGLLNMGSDFGIEFKSSETPLADPYLGGTSLGVVPNDELMDMGNTAILKISLSGGDYFLYAILSPIPGDPNCRPSVSTTLTSNPVPTVNPVSNQVVCNGESTTEVNFSGNTPGTEFNWTNNETGIGLAASGTGDINSFVAVNNGTTPLVATITVTPVYTNEGVSCEGSSTSFTITVNPSPTANQVDDQTYCNGATVPQINFTGSVPGTTYNWTRTPEVIGLGPTSGTGSVPSFTASNGTNQPVSSTFTVTPVFTNAGENCEGSPMVFTITVNPSTSVDPVTSQTYCHSQNVPSTVFTSPVPGTTYNWSRTPEVIGLGPTSGTGNIPSFTASNTTLNSVTSTFTVTPVYTNNGVSCPGTPITFTITVLPQPRAICQNITRSLDANGEVNLTPADVNGGSSGGTLSISPSMLTCSNQGSNNVILTVTDPCGISVSCTAVVTVVDDTPPTLNCPADITETLSPGECNRIVNFDVTMTDNCPLTGASNSFWGFEASSSTGNNIWFGVSFDLTNLTTDVITVDYLTQPIPNLGTREYQLHATTTVNTNVGNLGNPAVWELIGTADVTSTVIGNLNIPATFTEIPISGLELQPGQTRGVILWTPDAGGFTYANAAGLVSPHDNGELQMHLNGCAINATGPYTCTFGPSRGFVGEVFYSSGVDAGEVIQTLGDSSGTVLFPGTYTNCFEAEDAAGNVGECCFNIEIREFPNPTNVLVCNNLVNLSLDPFNCEGHINADMILEGGPYRCYDDYEIVMETLNGVPVSNPITGNFVGETIVVSVIDPLTGNSCWGYIIPEDKTIPNLECGVHTVGCDDGLNPGTAFAEDIFLTASHNLDDVVFGTAVACPTFAYSYLRVIDLPANGVTGEFTPEEFSMGVESSTGGINVTLRFYVFDDPSVYDPNAPGFSYSDLTQIGPDNEGVIPALNLDFWSMPVEDVIIPGGSQYLVWELMAPQSNMAGWVMGSNTGGEDTPTYFAASDIACAETDPFVLANIGFPGNWLSWVTGETAGGLPFPVGDDAIIQPPSGLGPFTVFNWDACGPATLTFEDVIETFGCDGDFASIINRHWVAVDGSGNTSECTQIIQVQRGDLTNYEAPPTWYADCSDNFLLDAQGNPHPSVSGSPLSDACKNIVGTYTDVRIDDACGGYKIVRTWTLLDWCTLETVKFTQILKVLNEEAPEFVNCPAPGTVVNVSTRFNDCVGDYIAQQLTAINNCTGEEITDIVVTASAGTVVWNQQIQRYQVLNLPVGQHTITYSANDGCDNIAQCTYILNVIDDVPPIAICDERTRVSLGSNGEAFVHVSAWDDGSYDNCGIASILAYRKGIRHLFPAATTPCHQGNQNPDRNDPRPQIKFCCADIGEVEIVVEVTDLSGNMNICWVVVEVEDKLPPVVQCPPNVEIDCRYEFDFPLGQLSDAELNATFDAEFGGPLAVDNCNLTFQDWIIQFDLYNTQCRIGTPVPPVVNPPMAPYTAYRRVFIAEDAGGNQASCIQDIVILPNFDNPFIGDDLPWPQGDIRWPEDETVGSCLSADDDALSPEALGSEPFLREKGCAKPVAGYQDQFFTFVDSACFKILRTWTVIDWCNHDPNTGQGEWSHVQVINVMDDGPAICNNCEDKVFVDEESSDCTGFADLELDVSDCTPDDMLQVSWRIDIFQTGIFDIFGNGLDASGNYPFGEHTIRWTVYDLCSNVAVFEYDFEVVDGKLPSPVCLSDIVTVIMPISGCIELEASSFDASSFDNCTATEDLIFSWSADVDSTTKKFCCPDAIGIHIEEIWVTDEAGNQDFCLVNLVIQDPNNTDGCGVSIVGSVNTAQGQGVSKVTVELANDQEGLVEYLTGNQNNYFFGGLTSGEDYTITPGRNDHPLNGVTTFDIALIQRHILGIQYLNSPYNLIAADVRPDGVINVLDIADLRALILGKTTEFAQNTSWRFVSTDQQFQPGIVQPPNQIEEDRFYREISTQMRDGDFVGVKIGDVNGSAKANDLMTSSERRTGESMSLYIEDEVYRSGEVVKVEFRSGSFDQLIGYQFTLDFDRNGLEWLGLEPGVLEITESNFGLHLTDEGMITTSWNSMKSESFSSWEVLFTLTFRATKDVRASEMFRVSSRVTAAEAYNMNGDISEVDLIFTRDGEEIGSNVFTLNQNQPNPFNGQTVIGFVLPEATEATMTIYDVTGKVVRVIEGDYTAGYNELTLERRDVGAAGVYYYQLDTDNHTATKKMIFVD